VAREAYIYRMVLEYLEVNKGLHSTSEILDATRASYPSIARAVRQLSKEKRIKKRHGPGNSYLYEFVTYEVQGKTSSLPVGPVSTIVPLSDKDLRDRIKNWLDNGWPLQTPVAAQLLLDCLSQIHQFYWLMLHRGMAVDQSDLDQTKMKLQGARDTAFKFAEFFDRLLATSDLWDARKSAEFMLNGVEDPASYIDTARNVRDALRLS
jgi:hypothetical protein